MSFSKKNLVRPVVATLIFVVLFAATCIGAVTAFDVGYSYESEVGSHFSRAKQTQTPEAFIDELDLALEGIENLGLEEGMSGRWFSWEQTPNHDVGWLIEWVGDAKERGYAVIEWRTAVFEDNTTNEIMKDVYEDKVRHLRDSINYDNSPLWVSGDAYYRVYHPLYYWILLWMPLLIIFTVITGGYATFTVLDTWDDYRRDRRQRRQRRQDLESEATYQQVVGYKQARCPQCAHSNNVPDGIVSSRTVRCSHCHNDFNYVPERGVIRVD